MDVEGSPLSAALGLAPSQFSQPVLARLPNQVKQNHESNKLDTVRSLGRLPGSNSRTGQKSSNSQLHSALCPAGVLWEGHQMVTPAYALVQKLEAF